MDMYNRFAQLEGQDDIDRDAAPLWLGWLFIASAVFYGYLLGWAVIALIRWAV